MGSGGATRPSAQAQAIAQIQPEQRDIDGAREQFERLNDIEKPVELARLGLRGQKERAWDQDQQSVCGNEGHAPALARDQCPGALAPEREAGCASHREGRDQVINHLARLFARELQLRIKPLGLSIGTFPALLVLWEGDGLTQRELIEHLDIEQPTMANTLARMERDGLIERRKDPTDGRAQRIWLTAAARALAGLATAAAEAVNTQALAGLALDERVAFLALIRKVIAGLQMDTTATGRPDAAA